MGEGGPRGGGGGLSVRLRDGLRGRLKGELRSRRGGGVGGMFVEEEGGLQNTLADPAWFLYLFLPVLPFRNLKGSPTTGWWWWAPAGKRRAFSSLLKDKTGIGSIRPNSSSPSSSSSSSSASSSSSSSSSDASRIIPSDER